MKKACLKKILFLTTIAYIGIWVFLSYEIDRLKKDTEIKIDFLQWAHSNHLKKTDFGTHGKKNISIKNLLIESLKNNQISPTAYCIKEKPPHSVVFSFNSIPFEKLSQFIDKKHYALVIHKLSLQRASGPGMVQGEIEF